MSFNSRLELSGLTGTGPFSYAGLTLLNDRLVSQESQMIVTLNGTELVYSSSAPGEGEYTLNKNSSQLTTGDTLVADDVLLIRRSTKKDALHVDWENNSPLAEDDLDLACQQLLFIAQEAVEALEVQRAFDISGMITGYRNQEYVLNLVAQYTFDIDSFSTRTSLGTVSVKLQIDGIDVTGSSHTASATIHTEDTLTANRVRAGSTLSLVLSSSSVENTHNLAFALNCTEA